MVVWIRVVNRLMFLRLLADLDIFKAYSDECMHVCQVVIFSPHLLNSVRYFYCGDFYIWQVIDGLKVGNEALKKVHEVLNVDEVERILEETREGIDKQRVCIVSHILNIIISVS
jgi:hypothetical protein